MCAALPLFPGERELQIMLAVSDGSRPARPTLQCEISDRLWSLISRCWNQEIALRPRATDVAEEVSILYLFNSSSDLNVSCACRRIHGGGPIISSLFTLNLLA